MYSRLAYSIFKGKKNYSNYREIRIIISLFRIINLSQLKLELTTKSDKNDFKSISNIFSVDKNWKSIGKIVFAMSALSTIRVASQSTFRRLSPKVIKNAITLENQKGFTTFAQEGLLDLFSSSETPSSFASSSSISTLPVTSLMTQTEIQKHPNSNQPIRLRQCQH